jgi:hypothetical protein
VRSVLPECTALFYPTAACHGCASDHRTARLHALPTPRAPSESGSDPHSANARCCWQALGVIHVRAVSKGHLAALDASKAVKRCIRRNGVPPAFRVR